MLSNISPTQIALSKCIFLSKLFNSLIKEKYTLGTPNNIDGFILSNKFIHADAEKFFNKIILQPLKKC